VKNLEAFGLLGDLQAHHGIHLTEPLGYIRFMSLVRGARIAITDSGGIQEETTYLGIRCLTLRPNTERPITITQGTNRLIGPRELAAAILDSIDRDLPHYEAPELWDGRTAGRVANDLKRRMGV
jgi:UDP-N-acetylglucosamine 2-epimerase (non-hydrolysing)